MQRLEVSYAVGHIYMSLGAEGLNYFSLGQGVKTIFGGGWVSC